MINKITEFFKDVRSEFTKIEWFSRRDILILTILVIAISGTIAIYLGIYDVLFTKFLGRIGIL